jgi:site-specific recombinase XerD
LAKKELRVEAGTTKKAVVQYRRDIARLKRDMQERPIKMLEMLKADRQEIQKLRGKRR